MTAPSGTPHLDLMNSRLSYGLIAKLFHWVLFVLLVGMLASGALVDFIAEGDSLKGRIVGVHKTVGLLALLLMTLRLLWWLINTGVEPLESDGGATRTIAGLVHFGLYAAVFTQALSGVAMAQLAGAPPDLFGWSPPVIFGERGILDVPITFASAKEFAGVFRQIHDVASKVLLALIGLHIVGGLYHHFGLRDDTLRRMWFSRG